MPLFISIEGHRIFGEMVGLSLLPSVFILHCPNQSHSQNMGEASSKDGDP